MFIFFLSFSITFKKNEIFKDTDSLLYPNNSVLNQQRSPSPPSFLGRGGGGGGSTYGGRSTRRQSVAYNWSTNRGGAGVGLAAPTATGKTRNASASTRKSTRRNCFDFNDFSMFYSTPITKYWLSLMFRLIYLCAFAVAVALPGCGYLWLDSILWIWAFMWLSESLWILSVWLQNSSFAEVYIVNF